MGCRRKRCHVVHRASAVVHMGQHQHRNFFMECAGNFLRLKQLKLEAPRLTEAFSNIKIGGEVAALADHGAPLRIIYGCDG